MIHKLHFSIDIKAEKGKIWSALWNDDSYRAWAGVFFEGSYVVADNWKEGSTVLFLAPEENGIYSKIEVHVPNEVIQFKHIGNVVNGKKQPIDDQSKLWSGATETYRLTDGIGKTTLAIEIDVMDEHLDFMKTTFPKALEKIKSNCLQ